MKALGEFARINKIEGNVFISFDLKEMEACDCIACDALKLECPEFIMPVLFDRSTSIATMRYAIPESYSDVEKFQGELKIEEVLTLYENILRILDECEDWYLKPEGFCFDIKYVYMNEGHHLLKFIYIPEKKQELDIQAIKYLMVSLLEKCNESSGGTIQLQLYKYFYKPKFSLSQFKSMLESYWVQLEQKEKSVSHENLEQLKETIDHNNSNNNSNNSSSNSSNNNSNNSSSNSSNNISNNSSNNISNNSSNSNSNNKSNNNSDNNNNKSNQTTPHSFYTPKVNRSQLSQEEIEEMVKYIYGGDSKENTVENTSSNINTKDNHGLGEQLIEKKVEDEMNTVENEPLSEDKLSDIDKTNVNSKKKNLFNNMFNQVKYQKSSTYPIGTQERSASLKSISVHARYDLPKHIEVQFVNDLFIIGRATRTGEVKGAHYEFGAEITPISHLHAQIERKEGSYYLQDLGSSNGTFLNGNKIDPNKPYLIEDGDKIAFAIAYSKDSIEYAFVE